MKRWIGARAIASRCGMLLASILTVALGVAACGREKAAASAGEIRAFAVGDRTADASTFAWSPDGTQVAVLGRLFRKVSLFDARTGARQAGLDDLVGGAASVGFTADGQVVAGPRDVAGGGALVWQPGTGETRLLPSPAAAADPALGHLFFFSIDRAGRRLVGLYRVPLGLGHTMRLAVYDLATLAPVADWDGPASKVAIAPDGRKAAFIGQDGQVSVIDLATGQHVLHIDAHHNAVLHLAWSADGRRLATATMEQGFGMDRRTGKHGPLFDTQVLKLWDAGDGRLVAVAKSVKGGVESMDFSRDGQWLAVVDGHGSTTLLDARTLQQVAAIASGGPQGSQEVRFSPDSRLLGRLVSPSRQLVIHDVALLAAR